MYDPLTGSWLSPDPLAHKYTSWSPYAYCAGNPVNFVDPDGKDWYSYTTKDDSETKYAWTAATSQAELANLGITGTYLGKAVVVFKGYYDESLSVDGKLIGEGAKAANVTVYGPNGESDIQNYVGYTMSSDFNTFGAIDNGIYNVSFKENNPLNTIPKTHVVNNGNPVECLYGINNYYPHPAAFSKTQKNAIYIHRTNKNGFAGYNRKTGGAVSVGCLLINASDWIMYEKQLNNVPYKLILNRK